MDLDTFECHSLGSIGIKDSLEGDFLYIRAISTNKIYFEYRIGDDVGLIGMRKRKNGCWILKKIDYTYMTDLKTKMEKIGCCS